MFSRLYKGLHKSITAQISVELALARESSGPVLSTAMPRLLKDHRAKVTITFEDSVKDGQSSVKIKLDYENQESGKASPAEIMAAEVMDAFEQVQAMQQQGSPLALVPSSNDPNENLN